MINGLTIHGHENEELSMFQIMQEYGSLVPDHITYIGVLFAYVVSHIGMVEDTHRQFSFMTIILSKERFIVAWLTF